MKKSEICRQAQLVILKDPYLKNEDKLAIIHYLHSREDTELTLEKIEEKEILAKAEKSLKEACQVAHKLSEATTAHNTAKSEGGLNAEN